MTANSDEIRRLNDRIRTVPETVNATWIMTRGGVSLLAGEGESPESAAQAVQRFTALRAAIANYSDWPEGNDPYGEHDFGALGLFEERLFFKIDYYHPEHDSQAPVPANTELCRRVLTIMRADEY